jgi:hypothetical protein
MISATIEMNSFNNNQDVLFDSFDHNFNSFDNQPAIQTMKAYINTTESIIELVIDNDGKISTSYREPKNQSINELANSIANQLVELYGPIEISIEQLVF